MGLTVYFMPPDTSTAVRLTLYDMLSLDLKGNVGKLGVPVSCTRIDERP